MNVELQPRGLVFVFAHAWLRRLALNFVSLRKMTKPPLSQMLVPPFTITHKQDYACRAAALAEGELPEDCVGLAFWSWHGSLACKGF